MSLNVTAWLIVTRVSRDGTGLTTWVAPPGQVTITESMTVEPPRPKCRVDQSWPRKALPAPR